MRTERTARSRIFAAALVVCAGASLVVFTPRDAAAAACAPIPTDMSAWPIVRSPRVPGLTLRLPRSYERERDAGPQGASPAASARWTHSSRGHLLVSRGEPAGVALPGAGPEYTRCEEKVGSAVAVIVSFARSERSAGPPAGAPYRVQARLRWPDGEEVVVVGDAADAERFGELLAAVRSIRRVAA